jgi:hypothetical protein
VPAETLIPVETPSLDDADETEPAPAQPATRARDRTLLICLVGVLAALVLAPGTWWLVKARERARAETWANAAVADKVESARTHIALNQWNEATIELQDALATKDATDLEEARDLLADLQQRQADAGLEEADAAVSQLDTARALRLLEAYLANPHGSQQERAQRLRDELVLATSNEKAITRLYGLSDAALGTFAATGRLTDMPAFSNAKLSALFLETLRRQLPAEQQRRAEILGRRQARIGGTPIYRELLDFVRLTRQDLQPKADDDSRLVGLLLDELGVREADERKAISAQLRPNQQPAPQGIAARISSKRANLKERFRTYRDFDKVDWQIFDGAVDWYLDQLLTELGSQ